VAICVVVNTAGQLIQSTVAVGSCVDYVLQTATEYATNSPSMTLDDVVLLSSGVVLTWVIAWCARVLRRLL
jgi:hypothetical protein